jgi:hypothetical protein
MLELTIEECKSIIDAALSSATVGPKTKLDDYDLATQLQAIQGVVNVVKGLQLLGWEISRPRSGGYIG